MRYDIKLDVLESNGITYHRKVARFLTEKLKNSNYKPSILIVGETDMLISRQLAKNFYLHILTKKQNEVSDLKANLPVFEDVGKETRIIPVTENCFKFEEYDIIVFLFTDIETFEAIISQAPYCKFVFLPDYSQENFEDLRTKIKKFLAISQISFNVANIDFPGGQNIAFFN